MDQNEKRPHGDEEKRDKIRRRFGGADRDGTLEVRRARKERSIFDEGIQMRVAVYCRVSTDSTEQLLSYIMQQKYYSDYVKRHPGWVLVEIYADEGISGTSLKHRDAFIRMLNDCDDGKIDLVLVKSVSRFARNAEDYHRCVNRLADHKPPIGVFFETECMFTLDPEKELPLSMLADFAQHESRAKSAGMNTSIAQRFFLEIFLSPPLLGYDKDACGNLVINEEEAETVRLIFAMYQLGYSCKVIAEQLETLRRKTKLGNIKWSASTVRGVLQNERHCGDIVARKTWTPNYRDHKSIKNRTDENGDYDRDQYYKQDHHPAIISRDDYIAVQKIIANAKYGGRSFMPELRVSRGGALHGFVSINPHWGAFRTDDYYLASKSVGVLSHNETSLRLRRGEPDLRGYEITRVQFFSTSKITSGIFTTRNVRFSGECIRKLNQAEYIELLVHPTEKIFAVRECGPEHRNAIRWAKIAPDKTFARQFGGSAFLRTLFDILCWNPLWGYRLRGAVRYVEDNPVAFFFARECEILIPCKIIPSERSAVEHSSACGGESTYIVTRSKRRAIAIPSAWRMCFGVPYYLQTAWYCGIDRAGSGIDSVHNTEPGLHPTKNEDLADKIVRLLTTLKSVEEGNEFYNKGSVFPE